MSAYNTTGQVSSRKPHNHLAGYVCELRSKLGGHVVIYDRTKGFDYDSDSRYIVKHEPFGACIPETSMPAARADMKYLANCESIEEADKFYHGAIRLESEVTGSTE